MNNTPIHQVNPELKDNTIAGKIFSNIGLGCVTFGREINEQDAFSMMDHAFNKGINFFDTAAAYGNGASETIIGKWLNKDRDKKKSVVVATKILPPFDEDNIERSVNACLQRLQTDTIDLLFLHRWDISLETPGSLEALNNLVKNGKVQTLGASNFTVEQLTNIVHQQKENNLNHFGFVQNNHNLAVSEISTEFKKVCARQNIKIVTYSPLGAGFLTGKHQKGIPAGTRFDLVPGHRDIYFNEAAYLRLSKLQEVAAATGHTPLHLALSWALHQQGIASVLIGGRTTAHIDQAIEAAAFNDNVVFAELEKK